jgi:hypothetical protein
MIKGQHPSVNSTQQNTNSSRRQHKAKPSKRVIAVDLPSNLQTIESVTTIFYPYGEVLLVRVLRPKKQLPFDLKQFQVKLVSNLLSEAILKARSEALHQLSNPRNFNAKLRFALLGIFWSLSPQG